METSRTFSIVLEYFLKKRKNFVNNLIESWMVSVDNERKLCSNLVEKKIITGESEIMGHFCCLYLSYLTIDLRVSSGFIR